MNLQNKYILRLCNNNNTDGVTLNATNDIFTINLPNDLKNRGACNVRLVSAVVQIEDVVSTNRIVSSNTRVFVIRSNINALGYDTENRSGGNTILGTGLILTNADSEVITLESPDAGFQFTCPSLPDNLVIEKMFFDPTTQLLIAADKYTATSLPCSITLELTFEN